MERGDLVKNGQKPRLRLLRAVVELVQQLEQLALEARQHRTRLTARPAARCVTRLAAHSTARAAGWHARAELQAQPPATAPLRRQSVRLVVWLPSILMANLAIRVASRLIVVLHLGEGAGEGVDRIQIQ